MARLPSPTAPFWSILQPGPPARGHRGHGTFGPAQGLQQDVVLANLLSVVLQLPPQLVQLLPGELPRGLCLRGEDPVNTSRGHAHLSTLCVPPARPHGPVTQSSPLSPGLTSGRRRPGLSLEASESPPHGRPPPSCSSRSPVTRDLGCCEDSKSGPHSATCTDLPAQELMTRGSQEYLATAQPCTPTKSGHLTESQKLSVGSNPINAHAMSRCGPGPSTAVRHESQPCTRRARGST